MDKEFVFFLADLQNIAEAFWNVLQLEFIISMHEMLNCIPQTTLKRVLQTVFANCMQCNSFSLKQEILPRYNLVRSYCTRSVTPLLLSMRDYLSGFTCTVKLRHFFLDKALVEFCVLSRRIWYQTEPFGTLGATITLSLTGKHPSQQIWEDSNSSQARMIQLLLSSPPMNL